MWAALINGESHFNELSRLARFAMNFRKFKYFLSIFVLCAETTSIASEKPESKESLCVGDEDIYFTCRLEGARKTVSICAAKNDSPDNGYVQYRYGTKSKIEFKYPLARLPPRGRISLIDVSRLAEGLGTHLKFKNDDYEYVVSNALVHGEVFVEKGGQIVFDKFCKGADYIPFSKESRVGLQWGVLDVIDDDDGH
ncbi:hypothetical protein P0D69_03655 [Paraburkholderia sediminicola]|uniref:hypothetical protein n=1 Tax=Paraburkholderia sediminicola TaxID=458836 RepID=UPI0038BDDDCA